MIADFLSEHPLSCANLGMICVLDLHWHSLQELLSLIRQMNILQA